MLRRTLLGLAVTALILGPYSILRPREPAPELIRLAVRATLHAMPTATPYVVEVTRIVEVTPLPTLTATETPSPQLTATPMPTATASPVPADTPAPEAVPAAASQRSVQVAEAVAAAEPEIVEIQYVDSAGCPATSSRAYTLVPVAGGSLDHPDHLHGDINLSLRGYTPVDAAATLVEINGPSDGDAPQLGAVVAGGSAQLVASYRVNRWDWGCGEHGCRSGEPVGEEVSLLGLAASPGMPVSIPSRNAEIYGGGYVALVLFADETRLTLVYTREDSVANGYSVHLENVCVDPQLLAAYRSANQSGRGSLPAVRNGEIVGVASGGEILVAVRDRGTFGDPRSRKDWWR